MHFRSVAYYSSYTNMVVVGFALRRAEQSGEAFCSYIARYEWMNEWLGHEFLSFGRRLPFRFEGRNFLHAWNVNLFPQSQSLFFHVSWRYLGVCANTRRRWVFTGDAILLEWKQWWIGSALTSSSLLIQEMENQLIMILVDAWIVTIHSL